MSREKNRLYHISLNDARKNYKLFKVSKKEFFGTDRIRDPLPEEFPENNL